MTCKERDNDPKYLEALHKSLTHHEDGVSRTRETYEEFELGSDTCALCGYHGGDCGIPPCFLYRRGVEKNEGGDCCAAFFRAWKAQGRGDFETFHRNEITMRNMIRREYDRVAAIQKGATK